MELRRKAVLSALFLFAVLPLALSLQASITPVVGDEGIGGGVHPRDLIETDGRHFYLPCQPGEVMAGIHGRAGLFLDKIGPRCVRVTSDGRWESASTFPRGSVGGNGGDAFNRTCPRNHAVVGFEANVGSYVNELTLVCRQLTDRNHTTATAPSPLDPVGTRVLEALGSRNIPRELCNARLAAKGIYGRAGIYVDMVGFKCVDERAWVPDYHYSPRNSDQTSNPNQTVWMNDPAGLVKVDGTYHLFYQASESDQRFETPTIKWDHATSRDLLVWADRPTVFEIDRDDQLPFTGSAISINQDDRACRCAINSASSNAKCIVAIFTRARPPFLPDANPVPAQKQHAAYSCDAGETFSAEHEILRARGLPEIHYRDPKVFRYEDPTNPDNKSWVMILAVGNRIKLYRTTDLRSEDWGDPISTIYMYNTLDSTGPYVETADLVKLPIENRPGRYKWVLTFSEGFVPLGAAPHVERDEPTPSFYLVGQFDGTKFVADGTGESQPVINPYRNHARRSDYGPDFYALQTWHTHGETSERNPAGRTVAVAWLNNWQYALMLATHTWQGQLTIPRTLSLMQLGTRTELIQRPIEEVALLRNPTQPDGWRYRNLELTRLRDTLGVPLGGEKSYEVNLDVDLSTAQAFEIEINQGAHAGSIKLVWARTGVQSGRLLLDRRQSFPLTDAYIPPGFAESSSVDFTLDQGRLRARLLVDRNSLEVFPGVGNKPMSALFYPHPDNDGLKFKVFGGTARINALDVHDLDTSFIKTNRQEASRAAARAKALAAAEIRVAEAEKATAATEVNTKATQPRWQSTTVFKAFSAADGWSSDRNPRLLGDVNGDGRQDIVGFADDGVYLSLASGSGFDSPRKVLSSFTTNTGGWSVANHPRLLGDVNGDGRDDIVGFASGGVYYSLSTGSGFATPKLALKTSFGYSNGWRVSRHPRLLSDVNNDGRVDIVGFANGGAYVSLSTGTAFAKAYKVSDIYGYSSGWRVDRHPRYMADVTGDGVDDIVGFANAGVYVAVNDGKGRFAPAKQWINAYGYNAGGWRVESTPA